MGALPAFLRIDGYLYAAIGIAVCFAIGYTFSLLVPLKQKSLAGLTIYRSLQPAFTTMDKELRNEP